MTDARYLDRREPDPLPRRRNKMSPELREVAQDLVDAYGWSALGDRVRFIEWLADRGLLSALDAPDRRADSDAADEVESHARWLLS